MKKIISLLAIAATLSLLAVTAFGNSITDESMQDPCSAESKMAIYGEFYKEIKGDQSKA